MLLHLSPGCSVREVSPASHASPRRSNEVSDALSSPAELGLVHHEQLPIGPFDLVLDECPGTVPLANAADTARGGDFLALPEAKDAGGSRLIERPHAVAPVDVERSDTVNLDDGSVGRGAEHCDSRGCERVGPGLELTQRRAVEP